MRHKGMLAAALALSLPTAAFASGRSVKQINEESKAPPRERITKPHQGAKEMARRRRQMARNR